MNGSFNLLLMVILVSASMPICSQEPLEQTPLEQQPLSIRGNRALPKTLYIAPWKRLGAPLEGGEWDSKLGEPLEPVEQDLFRKSLELRREGFSLD